jgi:hypothetical protein
MNKFGELKTKILKRITESYSEKNIGDVKEILSLIGKERDFKELYLFYEEIENKFFEDKENAKLYVEGIVPILNIRLGEVSDICKKIDKKLGKIDITENEVYSNLDTLLEKDGLKNLDKKIEAKKKLIEHLTTKKEIEEEEDIDLIQNESMLYAILANNFNVLYNNTLTEDQKKELKSYLDISDEELENKFSILKESIKENILNIVNEETNIDVKTRLELVENEMCKMGITKYNYYRLLQLKEGLL